MGWEAIFTIGVVVLIFAMLALTSIATDIILVGGVSLLLLVGILSPDQALAGMSNEGMATVAVLYVVGAGVRETGAVGWIASRLFGRVSTVRAAVARIAIPTAALSGFVNNTPLVAMLIPAITDWSRQNRISASKLMIPLSYAAILGGTCSLIGTSTNLVVNGLVIKSGLELHAGDGPRNIGLHMFDIAWVGLPAAIAGVLFLIFVGSRMLPDRNAAASDFADPRNYTLEMVVEPGSPLSGKTIEQAGLRHLPGVYLAEIDREGVVIPAVGPEEKLRDNDRLVFVGVIESVVDLQRIRGLKPATDQVFKLNSPRSTRCLIEAVVSNTCPVVGRTIRDGKFRTRYNAVVLAVARNGERINQKIGDIVLRPGDTLLLEAHPSFADLQRNNRDFFLVSRLDNTHPVRHEKALIAMSILIGMVLVASLGWLTMFQASIVAAGLMLATRCCSAKIARRNVDWEILVAIAASLSIGTALEITGAASAIAVNVIDLAGGVPWVTLAVVYIVTLVATELITNNAAAALMFPMAVATARSLEVHPMPFVITVMMAASAGFATPIGYQTNLMVYGPGGYRFADYLRVGIPLDILVGVVTIALTPIVWPF